MKENREVGEVLHISRSGRMIIKSSRGKDVAGLSRGTILVDSKDRSVAKVIELIGPVDSPYISALPLTDRVKKYIGARLYAAVDNSSRMRRVRRQDSRRIEKGREMGRGKDKGKGKGKGKEKEGKKGEEEEEV
ncbi:MAG: Gar1/Naf1 family protein [Candidatus Nitrosocaldus sp.]